MAGSNGKLREISRRTALGALGAGIVGATVASWPRLTGMDIPGRGDNSLSIAILGTAADAAARQRVIDAFAKVHPEIKVKVQAIQAADWKDFFTKILTMVAAGTPPDVVYVATEGAQLFAEKLAHPLDEYLRRDAADMKEYFADVHPSLVEAFMYKGSLFQLPIDWNAANMYYNTSALQQAGLERPADNWTQVDFRNSLAAMRKARPQDFTPYYWTNRLFGGVVPWLYANDTSFLKESKSTGGEWLWDSFYAQDPSRGLRSGGYQWLEPNADDPRVYESFDYLRGLVKDGLGVRPEEGGGNSLVGLFASNRIGMTPAGGYWVEGLHEAGMKEDGFDVQFFPRWRTQRHQFGTAGYAIMKTAKDKDAAWEWLKFASSLEAMRLVFPTPNTTPARRSMVNEQLYAGRGPKHWKVFYDTLDKFPTTGPIPAPPQQAAVETALMKNVSLAVSGDENQLKQALASMQRDLEIALRRQA
ncbi:extracellular solute-binding protein [Arthrobacter bambusae]|uniref:ABC-type glycerol-3-phosphate transport system substrate-binding protein n=1 Tax=Arthrobacter bambusae TaxID=1338426 RepID=A0AAW8D621_9MICC|nr:extracellular solute-binding protein [Arthrobacter bambusae]MDP9903592.1 ABC-type glycerol-3-phosphate transport system substrate-binding protein [Arthrobacter bambusae]MDQ0128414.1 ABC-type glycerol-3-phosphate transport system substrate-binding protein [Arthrobacter bambusae]MDQ0179755.1 ABC-type glycerol-3-phosphate transport system substrate-binding protein [Arthrobacter bambusae]